MSKQIYLKSKTTKTKATPENSTDSKPEVFTKAGEAAGFGPMYAKHGSPD